MSEAPSINDGLWPIHPEPQPDELLSCWMTRIARRHGLATSAFYRYTWTRESLSFAEIDETRDRDLLLWLSRKTATPFERVVECTLPQYAINSTYLLRQNSIEPSVLGYDRAPREKAARFCPRCLAEDPILYFRRRWRMVFVRACNRHRTELLRSCPQCKALIRVDRIPLQAPALASCHRCAFDLRQSAPLPLPSTGEVETILRLLSRLLAGQDHSARNLLELSFGRA